MIYFSDFSVPAGGADTWRLLFPSGNTSGTPASNLVITELEMFSEASPTTDLCVGGTASGSTEMEPASDAFDGSLLQGDWWRVIAGEAVGSWLQYQFASPQTIDSFRIYRPTNTASSPLDITLQKFVGGSPSDVLSFTNIVWDGPEWLRFNNDGSISGPYTPSTATGGTFSGNAAKGNVDTPSIDVEIASVDVQLGSTTAEDYEVVLATLNGSNVIQSILGTSENRTISTAGRHTFNFASPISVASGTRLATIVVRTDGVGTSPCRVSSSAKLAQNRFSAVGLFVYQSVNPTVGDSLTLNTTVSISMTVNHSF